ncbi:hypothetical protein GCM10009122_48500 [Fulvivirga kasyanovii]
MLRKKIAHYPFNFELSITHKDTTNMCELPPGKWPGDLNWEDNGGSLPALDAGGCRFESCFSDFENLERGCADDGESGPDSDRDKSNA